MSDTEMAAKLWDLANVITGFVIAQAIAFVYALVNDPLRTKLRGAGNHILALAAILVFSVVYILVLRWCNGLGAPLDKTHQTIWSQVGMGRHVCVVVFAVLDIVVLIAQWVGVENLHSSPMRP